MPPPKKTPQEITGWANTASDAEIRPTLREYARNNRKNQTFAEKTLWGMLRRENLEGFKFRRQHIIGSFIVDFYCPQARLVIEVDGYSHQAKADYDAERTVFLQTRGVRVLRVTNDDVIEFPAKVLEAIRLALKENP